jgi:chemotaxis protein CheY-P-specific phosphatase CheC
MRSFSDKDIASLKPVVHGCLSEAAANLSQMLGRDLHVTEPDLFEFEVAQIPTIFGGSQEIISGVYMGYYGINLPEDNKISYDGHVLLTFNIESAYEMAAILTEGLSVPLNRINTMTDSIFSEIGNVFGTSFISAMANALKVRIMPTVPLVINYRSTTILEYVQDKMKRKDGSVLLIKTKIYAHEHAVEGTFLLIPEDHNSLKTAIPV